MPKVLVCVFCSEEIEAQEKWLDVPGRTNEVAPEMLEGEQSPRGPQSQHPNWFSSAAPEGSASGF